MSRSGAVVAPAAEVGDTGTNEGASRAVAPGFSWLAALRGQTPAAVIAVVLVALWYGLGLYSDVPFAQEILGKGATSGQVLHTALSLPSPFVPLPHQVLGDFFGALAQPLDSPRGLWVHLEATGSEALLGLCCGTLLGVLIATLFVHSRPIESAFLPFVVASQTVPVLALAPIVVMTPRPGKVERIIPVDLPRPRAATTREDERFFHLVSEVRACLREEHAL